MIDPVLPHEIDSVLDGTMPEPRASEIRRQVAEDEVLRDRYGMLFELELLAPEAATDSSKAPNRPRNRWPWIVGPLVAAAALVLVLSRPGDDRTRRTEAQPATGTPIAATDAPLGSSALIAARVEHTQRGPRGVVYETWRLRDDGVWIGARVEESDATAGWRVTQRLVTRSDR